MATPGRTCLRTCSLQGLPFFFTRVELLSNVSFLNGKVPRPHLYPFLRTRWGSRDWTGCSTVCHKMILLLTFSSPTQTLSRRWREGRVSRFCLQKRWVLDGWDHTGRVTSVGEFLVDWLPLGFSGVDVLQEFVVPFGYLLRLSVTHPGGTWVWRVRWKKTGVRHGKGSTLKVQSGVDGSDRSQT